jgi:hypothetical protein
VRLVRPAKKSMTVTAKMELEWGSSAKASVDSRLHCDAWPQTPIPPSLHLIELLCRQILGLPGPTVMHFASAEIEVCYQYSVTTLIKLILRFRRQTIRMFPRTSLHSVAVWSKNLSYTKTSLQAYSGSRPSSLHTIAPAFMVASTSCMAQNRQSTKKSGPSNSHSLSQLGSARGCWSGFAG